VLLRLGDRARGAYTVSQVSAGSKNRFQFEIFGTAAAYVEPGASDELWIGHRNSPNQIIVKDPSLLGRDASTFADLPGGHGEGYDDTHKQVYRRFYRKVADPSARWTTRLRRGIVGMKLLAKIIESNEKGGWVTT